jgi:hypothetical protein
MPHWKSNYHKDYLTGLNGPLLYNCVEVINNYNKHLYDIDWTDKKNLIKHNADVILSNRILETDLQIVEQNVGGYHFFKPLTKESIFCHYDSLGPEGTLISLKDIDFTKYQKYTMFFEQVLNIKVTNDKNYWINIAEEYK